jgi:hypothetical protein
MDSHLNSLELATRDIPGKHFKVSVRKQRRMVQCILGLHINIGGTKIQILTLFKTKQNVDISSHTKRLKEKLIVTFYK